MEFECVYSVFVMLIILYLYWDVQVEVMCNKTFIVIMFCIKWAHKQTTKNFTGFRLLQCAMLQLNVMNLKVRCNPPVVRINQTSTSDHKQTESWTFNPTTVRCFLGSLLSIPKHFWQVALGQCGASSIRVIPRHLILFISLCNEQRNQTRSSANALFSRVKMHFMKWEHNALSDSTHQYSRH